ncbi:MAG: choice-of-anchor D domain-containing protein [Hamadaea sp.]|uniref:discoidin domain-containing protein n=1 Tax=Hamadaea sp. TaxID=2024425 RepID=UPI00180553EE|nr:glycosyl hydrolase family 28-related protein [Hamadaea sp.]NUT20702.1 choice-of-anchor D domain-containing protein [Hamadaea sp.]
MRTRTILVTALTVASLAVAAPAEAGRPAPTLATVSGTALALDGGGRGADVAFTEYEAENARTTGRILGPSRAYTSIEAEASGRRAVALDAGEYAEFVLAAPADAIDVRYSLPEGADSALRMTIDGRRGPDLPLTARFSHAYGLFPFTNDPADGGRHHYFDDTRMLLGRTWPTGTKVRLQAQRATVVDLADFEVAGGPALRPDGSLDATEFGADPTGGSEAGGALQNAIDAARTQNRTLWIPAGTYQVNRKLYVDHVTVRGAGPWRTTLTGSGIGVFGSAGASGVHLAGFALFGQTTVRDDSTSDSGLGGTLSDSTVEDLWIEHTKVGMWFDGPSTDLTVRHTRIQNVWADGINLHAGVANTVVEHTFVRNTGDDGMAMWSDREADHHNAFRNNTVVLPLLANGLAIYGGHDNTVSGNIVADTVTQGGGIHVGNRFGAVPVAGTTTIAGNVLVRTGSLVPNKPVQIGAIWFYAADAPMDGAIAVRDERLIDSSFAGLQFFGSAITGVTADRVLVLGAGSFAVQLQSAGAATVSNLVAVGLGAAGVHDCGDGFTLTRGTGNVGWSSVACGLPAAGQLAIAEADGVDFGFRAIGTAATLPIHLTNPGPRPITIGTVRPPRGYTAESGCGVLAVGASCTITVGFTPGAAANYAGQLTIESTSPAGPYVVGIKGIGFDPDGNLALGRTATASSSCCFWLSPANLVDGDAATYFESANNAFPQTLAVDLGQTVTVSRIVLKLPGNWGARTETLAVGVDGSLLVAAADYLLDPATGNAVTITFPPVSAREITLTVTGNTGWPAAQVSEFEVYAH